MSHDEKDDIEAFDDARVDRDDVDDQGADDDGATDRVQGAPDPGYSAFAEDFDDPLADWPGPDSTIDVDQAAERVAGEDAVTTDDAANAAAEEPDDAYDELAFPEDDGDEHDVSGVSDAQLAVDIDDANPDEGLVDDFLTDLDDDHPPAVAATDPEPDPEPAPEPDPLPDLEPAAVIAADTVDRDDPPAYTRTSVDAAGSAFAAAATQQRGDDAGDSGEESGRRISLLMIAVVVVAVVLLGVGGYGVLQERQRLEAEVRDLQASLATAMSPQESAAAREQIRALEVDKETLLTQVRSLREESAALRDALAAAEAAATASSDDGAEGTTPGTSVTADTPDTDAAAAAGAEEPQPVVADAPAPAAGGERWFVNFGSYSRQLVAEQWAEQLDVSDGEVVVQSAASGARTVYRVRVIGLASRDDAERVALGLERSFQLPRLWIGRQ